MTFNAGLRATDGCVDDIAIESYSVFWKVTYGGPCLLSICEEEYEEMGRDYASETPQNTFGSGTLDIRARFFGVKSIEITRIEIKPNNWMYGGEFYTIPVNRMVYPSSDASGN